MNNESGNNMKRSQMHYWLIEVRIMVIPEEFSSGLESAKVEHAEVLGMLYILTLVVFIWIHTNIKVHHEYTYDLCILLCKLCLI